MPSLTELPTELRQQILLLVLPEMNRVESGVPAQFIQLFHINQRLRLDMSAVAAIWTPVHYISSPSTLTSRTPRTRGWNLSRTCLDLFYTSFLGRIMWRHNIGHPTNYLHPELITLWTDAVPFLPRNVKEVWLDVTPAPAEKREHLYEALGVFVHDQHASQRFLRGHVQDVAALVERIDEHYGGRARIKLSGMLSAKSAFFVKAVGRKIGRELEFVGSWVLRDDVRCARLGAAVTQETLWRARNLGWCGTPTSAYLSNVAWGTKTGLVYAKLAEQNRGSAVIADVITFAELQDGEGVVALPRAGRLRRAFQHRVAADVGLKTYEASEGDDRHVVVRR